MRDKKNLIYFFDRAIEYSIYLLCFFLPISIALVEIFSTIIIFLFFIKKVIKPDFKFLKNRTSFFLFLFVLFCVLSLFNSGIYLKKSLGALFFKWFEYIIIFLAIKDSLEPKKIKNVIFIILLSATLIGIDGLFQRFFGFDFIRNRRVCEIDVTGSKNVITGPFKHYNNFGAYLVIVLSLAFALFLENKSFIYKMFFLSLVTILSLCLLFSFSRGAWVGFSFSFIFILFFSKKKYSIFLILSIIFLIIILEPLRVRLFFTFTNIGDAGRFSLWRSAISMIRENPFLGKGIGTFMDYLPLYNRDLGYQYAHNSFLQIAAETGILSLLFFILFISSLVYDGMRIFMKNKNYLYLAINSAIFGFCVHSFFDTQFYSLQLAVLFWVILGLDFRLIDGDL